ncbi:ferric-dicitrate binding protein FerR, regulates iron transport through sigma-19 [Flaviramulus basaltis]|uniref:Ferric-dicitrate binding protein FerR, regulates iron transport through sigma-19 n=1 Tax=Flaviramulus basaltis TaxID=369401 RepID=A0A1K2IAF9_9FLAO|nr:FecR domain-containing protein [Flaviramulus basaltis]SFZ89222.1 ferric-dicitrate binding protein FerR, regulates iron transport through sigma-19 [Flaviramulus basaltis]
MKRETLISKWLDNNLNDQELEAFKNLEDYDDLVKLNNNVQAFKADNYDTTKELENVLSKIKSKKAQSSHWIKPFMRVAALLAICFSLYYYTTTLDTTIKTEYAQKTTVELPDESTVSLNAKSLLVFNKKDWKKERDVELNGEAFFKVAKGSSFNVITKLGTVKVYGTQFNVKQRDNYFEVICYEGLVGVSYNSQETKLKPGDSFLIIDGKTIAKEKENRSTPSWLNNESTFKSMPYKTVIAEFERQYNVDITLLGIDSTQLFTGSFAHDNLDVALKSITLPLHVTYSKTNNTITLKRE